MAAGWNARRMPLLRHEMASVWGLTADWAERNGRGARESREYVDAFKDAELYHVTEEMCEVAKVAASTIPEHRVGPEHLPSPRGFLVWETPIPHPTRPLRAVLWGRGYGDSDRDHEAVEVVFFGDHKEVRRTHGLDPPLDSLVGTAIYYDRDPGMDAEDVDPEHPNETVAALRVVITTWLLMQQSVSFEETLEPDRAARRQLARLGDDPGQRVRVIRLRRPQGASEGDGSREYRHRWVVRGHWRRQWYPSRNEHIPIWITAYVAGPDGAPLLGGEKVYEWSR